MLGGARERSGRAGRARARESGRSGHAERVRAWDDGVRMDLSMGVLGHSELVGARD